LWSYGATLDACHQKEDRFVRVSVLDNAEKRVVKLGERTFSWYLPLNAGDPEGWCEITPCQFVCFDDEIDFSPSFSEGGMTSGDNGDDQVVTVQLSIVYAHFHEEDWQEAVCDHSECLELWKILELCLTGEVL